MIPLKGKQGWIQGILAALMILGAWWGHGQLDLWYQSTLVSPPQDDQRANEPPVRPSNGHDQAPVEDDTTTPQPPPLPDGPKLAIIIDDLGWEAEGTDAMLALPYPLTMAVLPDGATTRNDIESALAHGHEVFLHLPMEPLGGYKGRPQVVTTDMEDGEIDELVGGYLDQMPEAVGVNNHMGSKATADRRVAHRVLTLVGARDLVFVDSRTWRASLMCEVATELGIPCAFNHLFLDNERRLEAIVERLHQAAALARVQGQAVVIGHVHPVMAHALETTLPQLVEEGIHLVFARQLALLDEVCEDCT